jgi:hypothetical protein
MVDKAVELMPDFESYAEDYPIIRDGGWVEGYRSYGSVWFLKYFDLGDANLRASEHYGMVGIVILPQSAHYCWKLFGCGFQRGNSIDLPVDAAPDVVYAAATKMALESVAA